MLRIGRTVLDELLQHNLASRGAISFGDFHANPADEIYVGRALVEAYEWAESQDWIGVVVAPSLAMDVRALEVASRSIEWATDRGVALAHWDFVSWDVPFKSRSLACGSLLCRAWRFTGLAVHCRHEWLGRQRLYVVNWTTTPRAREFPASELAAAGLREPPEVARKYKNTLTFLKQMSRAGLAA
jgi:hypothetical protein